MIEEGVCLTTTFSVAGVAADRMFLCLLFPRAPQSVNDNSPINPL